MSLGHFPPPSLAVLKVETSGLAVWTVARDDITFLEDVI